MRLYTHLSFRCSRFREQQIKRSFRKQQIKRRVGEHQRKRLRLNKQQCL
jgi:hypothetical protein